MSALSAAEAKEFGSALKLIRVVRQMSQRDVTFAVRPEGAPVVSFQYLSQIERGIRTGVSDARLGELARIYSLPPHALDDLVLRGRVRTALTERGISRAVADAAWQMLEKRLVELGTPINTDLSVILSAILGQVQA